ncbi:MAG: hypothetical protein V7636_2945 [Actinomycetota bacterium]
MISRGTTILLTGPPGAGKTTTAHLWTAVRKKPAFPLDWDQITSTVVVADELRGLPSSSPHEQYGFGARVAAAEAKWITRSGVDCVLVGARAPFPPPELAAVWEPLDELDPVTIVLLPRADVCVARNAADAARIGEFAVPEEHVRGSFDMWHWERWSELPRAAVLDNSDMSQLEVVDELDRLVDQLTSS